MKRVRYAVVGLGYISQGAVLPAFEHARSNSELTALVSDDPEKLKKLSRRYNVKQTYSYEQYDDCLRSGLIDAVYIALPNTQHLDYTRRAAQARIHVLCEKPMAVTEEDCRAMIAASQENKVRLMIAYRLHFEPATLSAIQLLKAEKIGEPRFIIGSFSQQVKAGDIRLQRALGGGSVYDMGIYCLNAARYFFQAEPEEVFAASSTNGDARFKEVDEMTAVTLKFSGGRIASFTSSFGAADTSYCRIVGTKGDLVLEPAYDYSIKLVQRLTVDGKSKEKTFPRKDQFAAELIYFSNCVLQKKMPEPSGEEGLADVRIIAAIYRSAEMGEVVRLGKSTLRRRPSMAQKIERPPVKKPPELVHAESPSGE